MKKPNKYETHIKPRLKEIENWLKEGIARDEISKRLELGHSTIAGYRPRYPELDQVYNEDDIRKGKIRAKPLNQEKKEDARPEQVEIIKENNAPVAEEYQEETVSKEDVENPDVVETFKKLAFGYISDIEDNITETIFSAAGKELKRRERQVKRKMPVSPNLDALKLINDGGLVDVIRNYDSEVRSLKAQVDELQKVDYPDTGSILDIIRKEFDERLSIKNKIIKELRGSIEEIREDIKKKGIAIRELKSENIKFEQRLNEALEDTNDVDDFISDHLGELGFE